MKQKLYCFIEDKLYKSLYFVYGIKREQEAKMALIILFLAPAVIYDLKTNKIPNFIIAAGYITGFLYQGVCYGYNGIWEGILGAALPLVLLFPVFCIRGLGAGDLKLLSVAGIFLTLHRSMVCLIMTIFLGGMIALFKMLYQHNFKERILYFITYIRTIYNTGKFYKYNTESDSLKSKIHMSIPILCSALFCSALPCAGGFY